MRRFATVALALAFVGGCGGGDASLPLAVETLSARCPCVDTLLVLLPGAWDRGHDFVGQGFVGAVRERGIAADVALVDASVAYYRDHDLVERLDADVVRPARARGIRHVWIAGISIGGLGGLIYANERRGAVDGLLLMAPYLGERTTVAEVEASGGLARWAPPGTIPPDDLDRRLWQWLKTLTGAAKDADLPPVWLGYGREDRFAAAHRVLAARLPRDHVFTAPGGHDWPAWRIVWDEMLDAAPLPRDAACGPT